jgi:hypothetical protein
VSVTRATVRAAAKSIIQDSVPNLGTGLPFLLNDPFDYNSAVAIALRTFEGDVANNRIVHYVMPATVFRFVLFGTGAILPPPPPPLPVLTVNGATGSTAYSYRVAARNSAGQGLWSDAIQITNGNAALSGSNFNALLWVAIPGAASYDVFGRLAGQELLLHNVSTTAYNDTGADTPSGALGLAGHDAWIYDATELNQVWMPYFAGISPGIAVQGQSPVDENEWRIITEPGPIVMLEFENVSSTIGQTLRLEFSRPHVVDEDSAAYTSITPKYIEAFETLVAAVLLRMAANRYLQNAGSTGLPSDVVDRKSQSDQAASRAKDLMLLYKDLVGAGEPRGAASGFKDMNVLTQHNRGFLWHPTNIR